MSTKAEDTEKNILNTARKHFLKDGFSGASLRNIVKDAGLTTGAFYKYYPTKEALFDALTHAGVWEDDSQVKRMLVEWAPQVPGGKVEITIASYVENGRQNSNALVRA